MKEQQEELFRRWEKEVGPHKIFKDGLVDEGAYLSSPLRVLYLLKEVNSEEPDDLCGFLAKGSPGGAHTWNNITRWTLGLHRLEEELPWDEVKNIGIDRRKEVLKTICAVNVNKRGGTGRANPKELKQAAERDREWLKEQLDIYKPQLIVLCGTDWLYFDHIYQYKPHREVTTNKVGFVRETERGSIIIAHKHPAARENGESMYKKLIGAAREIMKGKV